MCLQSEEKGTPTLEKFACASILVLSKKYFHTQFYGTWFGEMKMEDINFKRTEN
ncbi:MAG: hypothetical protein H7254_07510 [Ferruginibacter sp.]|nr:hypothetical protein [Ferruginibacter sp.]